MSNPFKDFTVKVTALLSIAFVIHIVILKVLKLPLFDNKIVLSYVVNFLDSEGK